MADLKRRIAGRQADLAGKAFEAFFEFMTRRPGMSGTRVPDGCRQIRGRRGLQFIRVKSPFDWIVSYEGKVLLCDTKTTAAKSFPHSKIDANQVAELRRHEANGILAGYVLEFRALRQVYFYPAIVLLNASKTRGSLQPGGILLGSGQAFDVKNAFTIAPGHPGRSLT